MKVSGRQFVVDVDKYSITTPGTTHTFEDDLLLQSDTGDVIITSSTGIIDINASTKLDIDVGDFDVDALGPVNIDGTVINLNGTVGATTINSVGAVNIASSGNNATLSGTDAIITGSDNVLINSTNTATVNSASDIQLTATGFCNVDAATFDVDASTLISLTSTLGVGITGQTATLDTTADYTTTIGGNVDHNVTGSYTIDNASDCIVRGAGDFILLKTISSDPAQRLSNSVTSGQAVSNAVGWAVNPTTAFMKWIRLGRVVMVDVVLSNGTITAPATNSISVALPVIPAVGSELVANGVLREPGLPITGVWYATTNVNNIDIVYEAGAAASATCHQLTYVRFSYQVAA